MSGQASLNLGSSEILSHENSPNNPESNGPLNGQEPPGHHDAHATAQEDPWAFWRSVLITLAVALGIRQFLVEARYIPSGSMLPGLQLQDRLLVEKLSFRQRAPRRGEIVVFHALDAKNIQAIAAIQLKTLVQRMAKMELSLEVSDGALAELAKVGFDPVFGARPLKRAIQQRIENPLSKQLLEGKFPPKSEIPVDVDPINAPGQFQFGRLVH